MTAMVVLLLVSVTMAVSYAVVRTQITANLIHANSTRGVSARNAAVAGIATALRKMHYSTWTGVDQAIAGSLSANETFSVTYTVGDSDLTPASSDYALYPYRVTLLSTGTATDPNNAQLASTHRIRAVVQLAPRALSPEPTAWSSMQANTLYQTDDKPCTLEFPSRIEGPMRLQGNLYFAEGYSWGTSARSRYFTDLNRMRTNGQGDYRPTTGPISAPSSGITSAVRTLLTSTLGVTVNDISSTSAPNLLMPDSFTQYRLYAGGPAYNVPPVAATLQDLQLSADPLTNPLGLFYSGSDVTLGNNVAIQGTLVTRQRVTIYGANVTLQAVDMPNLVGGSGALRLPAVCAKDDFRVTSSGRGAVTGMVLVNDKFEVAQGPNVLALSVTGRVAAAEFLVDKRDNWNQPSSTWDWQWTQFTIGTVGNPNAYFTTWLQSYGLAMQPALTVKPDPTPLTTHWQDPTLPFYVPGSADPGLRWDMVSWKDNP